MISAISSYIKSIIAVILAALIFYLVYNISPAFAGYCFISTGIIYFVFLPPKNAKIFRAVLFFILSFSILIFYVYSTAYFFKFKFPLPEHDSFQDMLAFLYYFFASLSYYFEIKNGTSL